MTRLLLVRHGETTWNHEGRLQGQTDVELSDFGREQARRLGARLAGEPLQAAYASDLKRCWETATIALAGRGLALQPDPGLREVHLGSWQGRTWPELRAQLPEETAWVEADLVNRAPPGGESRLQLQQRIVGAVEAIAARHPDGLVLVVSHGGALRAFLCWVMLADLRASRRIEADNCGLGVVDLGPSGPRLVTWNDTEHLKGLLDPSTGSPRVE